MSNSPGGFDWADCERHIAVSALLTIEAFRHCSGVLLGMLGEILGRIPRGPTPELSLQ